MNISFVDIANWSPPGDAWWKNVASKPDEPLIEAIISLSLSWREYRKLTSGEIPENGSVHTPAAAGLRYVFTDADEKIALMIREGKIQREHAGAVLAVFGALRDAVRPFNETLADELIPTQTESEVRG